MSTFKVGDLVHVPSETLLYDSSQSIKLKTPRKLLIIGQKSDEYKVIYDGKEWSVHSKDVYK